MQTFKRRLQSGSNFAEPAAQERTKGKHCPHETSQWPRAGGEGVHERVRRSVSAPIELELSRKTIRLGRSGRRANGKHGKRKAQDGTKSPHGGKPQNTYNRQTICSWKPEETARNLNIDAMPNMQGAEEDETQTWGLDTHNEETEEQQRAPTQPAQRRMGKGVDKTLTAPTREACVTMNSASVGTHDDTRGERGEHATDSDTGVAF